MQRRQGRCRHAEAASGRYFRRRIKLFSRRFLARLYAYIFRFDAPLVFTAVVTARRRRHRDEAGMMISPPRRDIASRRCRDEARRDARRMRKDDAATATFVLLTPTSALYRL